MQLEIAAKIERNVLDLTIFSPKIERGGPIQLVDRSL